MKSEIQWVTTEYCATDKKQTDLHVASHRIKQFFYFLRIRNTIQNIKLEERSEERT